MNSIVYKKQIRMSKEEVISYAFNRLFCGIAVCE